MGGGPAGGGGGGGEDNDAKASRERGYLVTDNEIARNNELRKRLDLERQSYPVQTELEQAKIRFDQAREQAGQARAMGGSMDLTPFQSEVDRLNAKLKQFEYKPQLEAIVEGRGTYLDYDQLAQERQKAADFNKQQAEEIAADNVKRMESEQKSVESQRQFDLNQAYNRSETAILNRNKSEMEKKIAAAKEAGAQTPTGMVAASSQKPMARSYTATNLNSMGGANIARGKSGGMQLNRI